MMKFRKNIFSFELSPPRGIEAENLVKEFSKYKNFFLFVNVTDNQRANVRMSSLAMSLWLLKYGITPNMQITARDRNILAIQSDILGAYSLGIRYFTAMTGDHPKLGDHKDAMGVYEVDSLGILKILKNLKEGFLLNKKQLDKPLKDIVYGAVYNPYSGPKELQERKLEKKISLGATFIQTQPIYSIKIGKETLKLISNLNAYPILGILAINSRKMLEFLEDLLPGAIDESLKRHLLSTQNIKEAYFEYLEDFLKTFRGEDVGFHFMFFKDIESLTKLLEKVF